ncbi:MAG TPA: DMT family transporter [Saprospiraceae bacterium]|nr:DMT family transporter [Saprospiraceae bacterium]
MNPRLAPHLALFTVGMIYGLNYALAKMVMNGGYLSYSAFILSRVFYGLLFFGIATALRRSFKKIDPSDYLRFFLSGVFGVAINQLMFFKGLELTTPVNASLIMTNTPVLVIFMSVILGAERFAWRKMIGLILGAIGAVLLITKGLRIEAFQEINFGDLYVLINASAFALYLIISKPLLRKYSSIQVVTVVFASGFIVVLPVGAADFLAVDWTSFGVEIWLSFAFVLVFTTGFAYLLNAFALQKVNPSVVSIYIYLQPVIATSSGWWFGQNQILPVHIYSAILIFTAVFLVSWKNQRNSPKKN